MRSLLPNTHAFLILAGIVFAACQTEGNGDETETGDSSGDTAAVDAGLDSGIVDSGVDGGEDDSDSMSDSATDTESDQASGGCTAVGDLVPGEKQLVQTCEEANDLEDYTCSVLHENGPDLAFRYISAAETPLSVTATLTAQTADLDLFLLLDHCQQSHCVTHGAAPDREVASTVLLPGQVIYVVADGYGGVCGSAWLEWSVVPVELDCADQTDNDSDGKIDCDDGDCEGKDPCVPHCTPDGQLSCAGQITGNTAAGRNLMTRYRDYPTLFPGHEWVWEMDPDLAGVALAMTLTEGAEDQRLMGLFGECSANQLMVDPTTDLELSPTGDYPIYVVVDGLEAGGKPFAIDVQCSEINCADNLDNDGDQQLDCADADCNLAANCVVPCDPVASIYCSDLNPQQDFGCYLRTADPLTGYCHPAGSGEEQSACRLPSDCRPGLICTPADICLRRCLLTDPTPDCPANTTCRAFGADPLGICW